MTHEVQDKQRMLCNFYFFFLLPVLIMTEYLWRILSIAYSFNFALQPWIFFISSTKWLHFSRFHTCRCICYFMNDISIMPLIIGGGILCPYTEESKCNFKFFYPKNYFHFTDKMIIVFKRLFVFCTSTFSTIITLYQQIKLLQILTKFSML